MLRFMGIALAALLAVGGLAFAAGDEEAAASAYQLNPPGTYPVVDEKVTITAIAYYSRRAPRRAPRATRRSRPTWRTSPTCASTSSR